MRIHSLADYRAETVHASDGARLICWKHDQPQSDGIHFVFVPGWCMPSSIWRFQLRYLAQRHAVTALDPRGQGDSEVPAGGFNVEQRARDIASCLAPLSKVVLVGWSLGALEVLQYVHDHGEKRLAGLILVDSSVGENPPPLTGSAFREALRTHRRETLREFVKGMFRTSRSAAEIEMLTLAASRMPLDASLSLFPSHLPREHWRGIARGIRVPMIYAITPQFAGQAENLCAARPATRIEIFNEAGHALFVDEPRRFNKLIFEFASAL